MAYVDDTNCLLPIEDVKFFLDRFKFYGEPLFRNVDYTENSEKLWFGTQVGPGGSGHVFTFYKQVESEACITPHIHLLK